ncbi:MAG TPA: dTDP-4-dehydrorhamnose reductase [Chitinophagaceae bacterium]|nr:dTDP-4-dehydrorhamnose reductase [Chitinophagaceae bacterium]
MSNLKILITGANGQLGNEFRSLATRYHNDSFIFLSRQELSIDDAGNVQQVLRQHNPDWVVNCAAYTAVDKAETEKEQAMAINAEGAGILASVCTELGAKFIHISTDYVFDGSSADPYNEDAATSPINTYGHTKLRGEQLVLQNNPDAIIIRTSWVYSYFGNNFVKTMMRLMKERESINVVSDQVGSPTYAADLASAIMHIIHSPNAKKASGIFHYSNEGRISWYEFAQAIKELIGSNCCVNPIPSSQYPTPARRPQYSLLDKSRIRGAFDLEIPDWRKSLEICIVRLKTTAS